MAKFRRNHDRKSHSLFGGMRILMFIAFLSLSIWGAWKLMNSTSLPTRSAQVFDDNPERAEAPGILKVQDQFLPTSSTNEIIKHEHYAISYHEKHEQAEWVAYELTKESIQLPNVERTGDFRPDRSVAKSSAHPSDYKRSGYDRGHMVPAGDMAFSKQAMSETFFMSNISPQIRGFNGGIWRELEENIRNWAYKFKHLYIISGPILNEQTIDQIGDNSVSVPSRYYKVLLDNRMPKKKAIAFIIPNAISDQHLEKYATSIDEVERITGLDFFPKLPNQKEIEQMEKEFDVELWPIDERKFDARIEIWNNR